MTDDFVERMQAQRDLKAAKAAAAAELAGVSLSHLSISYQGEQQPVQGVTAVVETAGQLSKRPTVTRALAGGILLGPAGLVVGALFRK